MYGRHYLVGALLAGLVSMGRMVADGPERQSSIVGALRGIAAGTLSPRRLADDLTECAASGQRFQRCAGSFEMLVTRLSESGSSSGRLAREATDLLSSANDVNSSWFAKLRDLATGAPGGRAIVTVSTARRNMRQIVYAAPVDDRPPSQATMMSDSVQGARQRLARYIDAKLPVDDLAGRINGALTLAELPDCEALGDFETAKVCKDIGIAKWQSGAARVVIAELQLGRADPAIAGYVLSVGKPRLRRISENLELTMDEPAMLLGHLFRRWVDVPPNVWQAWADVEEMFGSPW